MNLLNRDGFLNPLHGNSNRGGFLNVVASTLTLKHASGGGSGDLQITQQYLSSGHQSCSIYLNNNGVLGQQQPQLTRFAFPVNNPASVIEPFSNLQNNDQLQMVSNIGAASYPLQHAKSIEQSSATCGKQLFGTICSVSRAVAGAEVNRK
jgi:dolichyl-phosphate-mannose--protein O-mannosyl transferase